MQLITRIRTTMPLDHSLKEFLGKKVLIVGDVGSGKTKLTLELLNEAIQMGFADKITLIDMAPATMEIMGRKIGGKMGEFSNLVKRVRYLAPSRVETPRLSAGSAQELLQLVQLNKERIDPVLNEYVRNPTSILFINDVSIYFQSGTAEPILSIIKIADTFIANGYYGRYLTFDYGTGVSETERKLMDLLSEKMDAVIRI